MFRTRLAISVAAVALLGISACGGDSVAEKIEGAATDSTVLGGGDGGGDGGGGVAGGGVAGMLPEECRAIYGQIIGAMAGAMSPGSDINVDEIFGAAKDKVPDELKGDIDTLSKALATMSEKMKDQNDPAAMAQVIAILSTPDVSAASDRINAYFEETCPQ